MAIDDIPHNYYLHNDASHNGQRISGGVTAWEVLTKVELDSAYISEKLLNLEILLMQVETRESEYEAPSLENGEIQAEALEMAFEYDILSGILNSEVKELDNFMAFLQIEIMDARDRLSPNGCFEVSLTRLEEKLQDAEEQLKQSRVQVADVKMRAAKFERTLTFGAGGDVEENGDHTSANSRWKLHNVEHQRRILQSYEKSLAKELDLEKKLTDSRLNEDELKLKLKYTESELYNMEESMEVITERVFAAENASELLLRTSEELIGELQKFSAEGSPFGKLTPGRTGLDNVQVSGANGMNLKSNVEDVEDVCSSSTSEALTLREKVGLLEEQLKESDFMLQQSKISAEESQKQQNLLHSELSRMELVMEDLRESFLKTEIGAEIAEANCEQLRKANRELTEELNLLRHSGEQKAKLLERKLKESDIQLEHAKASIQAIEEQQNMLNSTFIDMGNLIEDLKAKVSKAENRAESAESKCSLLTETNVELNEELNFLRGRIECLEASLRQADEGKIATAKDIGIRTRIISDLVMKLAVERERLQLQISGLTENNRFLMENYSKEKDEDPVLESKKENTDENDCAEASGKVQTEPSSTEFQDDNSTTIFAEKTVVMEDTLPDISKFETVRNIEPTQLHLKYLFIALVVVLVSVIAGYLVSVRGLQ